MVILKEKHDMVAQQDCSKIAVAFFAAMPVNFENSLAAGLKPTIKAE